MIVFNSDTKELIYPYNERVSYWVKKWGITRTQLDEAVLETGSINIRRLKRHLVKKGIVFSWITFSRYINYRLDIYNRKRA